MFAQSSSLTVPSARFSPPVLVARGLPCCEEEGLSRPIAHQEVAANRMNTAAASAFLSALIWEWEVQGRRRGFWECGLPSCFPPPIHALIDALVDAIGFIVLAIVVACREQTFLVLCVLELLLLGLIGGGALGKRFLKLFLAGSLSSRTQVRAGCEACGASSETGDVVLRRLLRQEVFSAGHVEGNSNPARLAFLAWRPVWRAPFV
ncbi:hypothetical protein KC330_g170 [Hortaea werneckii]|nr:hypothetical protein KC330_g170 [Hortaea werneckii]